MDKMEALIQFVRKHTTRGTCKCLRCGVSDGTTEKPTGHTINLTFFEVGMLGDPDAETFKQLAQGAGIMPAANGKEVNYIKLGGDIGDQGTALLTMGLGHLLGAWKALSPDTLVPDLPWNLKQQMAGQGMVSIMREKETKPSLVPVAPMPVPPASPAEELEKEQILGGIQNRIQEIKNEMGVPDLVILPSPKIPLQITPIRPPAPPTDELAKDTTLMDEALANPVRIPYEGDIPRPSKRRGRRDA